MPRSLTRLLKRKASAPGCAVLLLLLVIGACTMLLPSTSGLPTSPPHSAAAPVSLSAAHAQSTSPAAYPLDSQAKQRSVDEPITVTGWNVGLDDADVHTIAARIADFDGVDLWGIAEVDRPNAVVDLVAAAEAGEYGDFAAVQGQSGGGMRLMALYDESRFDLLESYELEAINTTGNPRAPLVLHLRDTFSGEQFLFMVNHLYRSRDEERHKQAQLLNDWAENKTLPVIAVGDYNFDWDLQAGEREHDLGYDLMTSDGVWEWVRPAQLATTQCSGWPCRYNSVLDFVFTAGAARDWRAESEIVVTPGDFPDDTTTSDHRPVLARFWPEATEQTASAEPNAVPAPTLLPAVGSAATAVEPPVAPAPVNAQSGPIVNSGADLRGGPGTDYPVVGGATAGQAVEVIGRSTAGDWLQLADGTWIAAFLVDSVSANLSVVEAPLPPPAPTVEEHTNVVAAPVEMPPTATPAPPPVVEQPQSNCDPSYPTLCIPLGSNDLDCGDIPARRFPVVGSDRHRFDGDHDGVGCESG